MVFQSERCKMDVTIIKTFWYKLPHCIQTPQKVCKLKCHTLNHVLNMKILAPPQLFCHSSGSNLMVSNGQLSYNSNSLLYSLWPNLPLQVFEFFGLSVHSTVTAFLESHTKANKGQYCTVLYCHSSSVELWCSIYVDI